MGGMMKGKLLLACLGCFLLGWAWGNRDPVGRTAEPAPTKAENPAFPMAARLGSNLYVETSAEYRACCLGIYRCAELRLQERLATARPRPSKPAVVMDLDETVFDNSAFQTFLYRNKLEYTPALWDVYEEQYPQDVALVPGARRFIGRARELGVTVVFISNRSELYKESTGAALERLGIGGPDLADRLYLKPKGGSSDKSARREAVKVQYNVLMYFGDNLRDFSESFAARKLPADATAEEYREAIKQRQASADKADCHWGVDWFVLPNPVYGEWEKLIGPNPNAIMHPTNMPGPTTK